MLRVYPTIVVDHIRADFHMNANQFGLFSALTLYAYSFLQIPLGFLTDKIGIRVIITWSIVICILSTYLITSTSNLYVAYIARFFTGVGSACALMIALKIVSDYMPVGQRGFLIGATLAIGSVGPIAAGTFLIPVIDIYGWRGTLVFIDFVGLILLLLTFFGVTESKAKDEKFTAQDYKNILREVILIVSDKRVLYYSILAIGLYAPFSGFADFWATNFLMQKYSLPHKDASQIYTMLYFGLGVGCLVFPFIAEKTNSTNLMIKLTLAGLLVSFVFLLYGPSLSHYKLMIILFLIGMFSGGEMICFTGACLNTKPENSGLTIGIVNTFNMLGAPLAQNIVGSVLDFRWTGKVGSNGLRFYTIAETTYAMSFLIYMIIACAVLAFWIRKSSKNL